MLPLEVPSDGCRVFCTVTSRWFSRIQRAKKGPQNYFIPWMPLRCQIFMTNELTGVRLNYKRNFSNSQESGKKLSKNFYTFTFEIRFRSTISFYILTLTIFLNTRLVVICYIWAAVINFYFNDSMMDCILETFYVSPCF